MAAGAYNFAFSYLIYDSLERPSLTYHRSDVVYFIAPHMVKIHSYWRPLFAAISTGARFSQIDDSLQLVYLLELLFVETLSMYFPVFSGSLNSSDSFFFDVALIVRLATSADLFTMFGVIPFVVS